MELLRYKESRRVLQDPKVQGKLVKILEHGETCLPAMEMLSLVSDRAWKKELSKEICNKLTVFAKKRDEIILCPGPLLFCVLAYEFLMRIAEISL